MIGSTDEILTELREQGCIAVFGVIPLESAVKLCELMPKGSYLDERITRTIGATMVCGPKLSLDSVRTKFQMEKKR